MRAFALLIGRVAIRAIAGTAAPTAMAVGLAFGTVVALAPPALAEQSGAECRATRPSHSNSAVDSTAVDPNRTLDVDHQHRETVSDRKGCLVKASHSGKVVRPVEAKWVFRDAAEGG